MFIGLLTIPVVISAVLVVFTSLMIHGVHKFKRRLLYIYINVVLIYSFFYVYSNGFILLYYNIMLGTHTEESSMDLNQSKQQAVMPGHHTAASYRLPHQLDTQGLRYQYSGRKLLFKLETLERT